MLILGLVLVVLSVAGAAVLVAYNNSGGPEQTVVLFGRDLISVTPMQAFLWGIGFALIFALGLWMVVVTGRARRAARAQAREARRDARAAARQAQEAARERDQLADQLAKERSGGSGGTAWTPPPEGTPTTGTTTDRPAAETQTATRSRGIGRHFRRTPQDQADVSDTRPTTPGQSR